jgi:hypothetical protein
VNILEDQNLSIDPEIWRLGGGFIAQQRNVVLVGGTGTGKTYKGRELPRAPRTDPCEPNSGTRLPPRVCNGAS